MVDDKAYPIDVAYSLVQEDEEVAAQVDSLLKNRLSTFLYSERQGELVGADGEARLKRVFGEEARIVVVFYRTEWGTTPWTRIEETAIRNRAYTEGYDFTICVCMDQSKLKDWVPKTHIWFDMARWGVEGAASAIESRVTRAGGVVRPETAAELAVRIQREKRADSDRQSFLQSRQGFEAACRELDLLFQELDQISGGSQGMILGPERTKRVVSVASRGFKLVFALGKAVDEPIPKLDMTEWDGPAFGLQYPGMGEPLRRVVFTFDRDVGRGLGWRRSNGTFLSTSQLADWGVKELLQRVARDSER